MNYEGFRNVLKNRYRDIMAKMRYSAIKDAKKVGRVIERKDPRFFSKLNEFLPSHIHINIWRDMCKIWDTDEWKKKSESGTRNHASTDTTNKRPRARHTGGSLGFDEHRVRLKNKTGQEPSFREVFLQTHLTKESKARLDNGELEVNNMEGMDFCTTRAREIYGEYLIDMKELYGAEFTMDDATVWKRVQGRKARLYGIGSTDINYLMTGKPSASFGVGPSQDKILALENQIQDSEARFEEFEARLQAQREADRKAFEDALKAQREAMQKDSEELIKSGGPSN